MTSFRHLVFSRVLVLISSLRPITGFSLFDQGNRVCTEAKFSKPESQYDRAIVGWALATYPGSFSATSESSTASGYSPLRIGVDSQERCAASHAFGSTLLWCSYCCRIGSCLCLDELNWFSRERDILSQVKNLSFLKMTPFLNTGE